jgi:uncharacterized protein (TIGR02466 family)
MQSPTQLTINHMDLFPTRVWVVGLDALNAYIPQWVAAIEALRLASPQAAGRSNRAGWNSAPTLFEDAQFAPLLNATRSVMDHVLAEMGPPTYPIALEAWANVHDAGGHNAFHNHPGALLSACYYLQVPQGSGPLVLRDPRPGAMLSPWQGSLRPNNGSEISIAPLAGQLIVFPNWLEHSAEVHGGVEPRISIPINAALKMPS